MQLQELKLQNFRNFFEKKLRFAQRNLICGKNGSGKTNLLEGIHLACTGKSFRGLQNRDFFLDKHKPASLFVRFAGEKTKTISQSLILQAQNSVGELKKEFFRDGKKIPIVKFLGKFPVILFAPEELRLVWGTPKDQRAILDLLVTQFEPTHALKLLKLLKVLRQRNKLLFIIGAGHAQKKELAFWDQEFLSVGTEIIWQRNKVIVELNQHLSACYQDISGTKDQLELILDSSAGVEISEQNKKKIQDLFAKKLTANLSLDLKNLFTNTGPHRDEPRLFLNGRAISNFASRGEGRTAVLAFKFAQKAFFEESLGKNKILFLLDDAFSELDKDRAEYLLNNLGAEQSIFTATEATKNLSDFQIIKL